jgi:hypothetical protein
MKPLHFIVVRVPAQLALSLLNGTGESSVLRLVITWGLISIIICIAAIPFVIFLPFFPGGHVPGAIVHQNGGQDCANVEVVVVAAGDG